MPPKVKPRIWCGMPIPVRVGFCLMRRAGRREKARRLMVLPLFHVLEGESAPSRYMPERGAGEVCSTVRQDFLAVILI